MEPVRITIGLSQEVFNLQQSIQNFPPNVPILLDDIVGKVVKLAGSCDASETEEYIEELKFHLRNTDQQALQNLFNQIRHLKNAIRQIYVQYNFLDEYGSSEFRFNGYVGIYEIQLWRQVR